MDLKINNDELKEIILKDKKLQKLFQENNYICDFDDSDWWLLNKSYFVSYFDGLEKLCDKNNLNISKCNQESKGFRYKLEIVDTLLTLSVTECNCNLGRKIERFYYFYDFPKYKLNYSFQNLEYWGQDIRKKCIYEMQEIIKKVRINQEFKGLYLYGKPGIGKTFTFILFANLLAKENKRIAFISMPTLFYKIQNYNNASNVDYVNNKNFYKMCLNAEILFIDDIGTGYLTKFLRDGVLFHILNHRMNHCLPTFFTSNYSINQLSKWLVNITKMDSYNKNNDNNFILNLQIQKFLRRLKELTIEIKW